MQNGEVVEQSNVPLNLQPSLSLEVICAQRAKLPQIFDRGNLLFYFLVLILTAIGSEQYGQFPNRTSNDLQNKQSR